jgi:hypothetical protein
MRFFEVTGQRRAGSAHCSGLGELMRPRLAGAVSPEAIRELAGRHGLHDAWIRFRSRFLDERN